MRTYRRITFVERCQISAKLQAGRSISEIALELGFHKSSISREINRNKNQIKNSYEAIMAEKKAAKRFRRCRRPMAIDPLTFDKIQKKMELGWSPKQIANRFKLEKKKMVSHQTIYSYIIRTRDPRLKQKLRRYKKVGGGRIRHRRRFAITESQIHISNRSKIANERGRLGDWERDTFFISNRHQVLVLTDRKSRYMMMEYIGKGTGKKVKLATAKMLKRLNKKVYTMTSDNGPEFKKIPEESFKVYKCTPKRPQERGTVENTIGLIRQYIKGSVKVHELTKELLRRTESYLNNRPREVLGYRTPYEIMHGRKVAMAT